MTTIFATQAGGPMIFTFDKILTIEKKKLTQEIQNYGGKVVEYSDRNNRTIVLTKSSAKECNEIQFDVKYAKDCLRLKKLLPIDPYKIGKPVKVNCLYSQPLGTRRCVYTRLILLGKCKKHKRTPDVPVTAKLDLAPMNDETKMDLHVKFIKDLVYTARTPQVKNEPDSPKDSMEVASEEEQESQSFEESQDLLRKKPKSTRRRREAPPPPPPLKGVKKKQARTKRKSRRFRGGSRRRRLRARH